MAQARRCEECKVAMPPYIPRKRKGDTRVCWACAEKDRGGYVSAGLVYGEDYINRKFASPEYPTPAEGGEYEPGAMGDHLRNHHGITGEDDFKRVVFDRHIQDNHRNDRPLDSGIPTHDMGGIVNFITQQQRDYHQHVHDMGEADHEHDGVEFTKPIEETKNYDRDATRELTNPGHGDPKYNLGEWGPTDADGGGVHQPWREKSPIGRPRPGGRDDENQPNPNRVMRGLPNSEMNGVDCPHTYPDAERDWPQKGSRDDKDTWDGDYWAKEKRSQETGWENRFICPDCHAYKALHTSDEWNKSFKDRMNALPDSASAPFTKYVRHSLNSLTASVYGELRDQDSCPHDGEWNLHGQCKQCGYLPPTEGDEPCDHEWCVANEPEHTKGEHIDPPHLDRSHPDYHSAEQNINDALADHPDAWLLHHQSEGPSKYSMLDAIHALGSEAALRVEARDCAACDGTGDFDGIECGACEGSGERPDHADYEDSTHHYTHNQPAEHIMWNAVAAHAHLRDAHGLSDREIDRRYQTKKPGSNFWQGYRGAHDDVHAEGVPQAIPHEHGTEDPGMPDAMRQQAMNREAGYAEHLRDGWLNSEHHNREQGADWVRDKANHVYDMYNEQGIPAEAGGDLSQHPAMKHQVGWVRTDALDRHREYDRTSEAEGGDSSRGTIDAIKDDWKAGGRGILNPVQLSYSPDAHTAKLVEGNHRLVAAKELGLPALPTRVVRAYRNETGGTPVDGPHKLHLDKFNSFPDTMHPSEVLPDHYLWHPEPGMTRESFLIVAEINSMLDGFSYHPKVEKDLRAMDKPTRRAIQTTLDSMRSGDPNLQTHKLKPPFPDGWYSTKASRGHRIVHQPSDDGGTFIGAISLHDYNDAQRRLSLLAAAHEEGEPPQYVKPSPEDIYGDAFREQERDNTSLGWQQRRHLHDADHGIQPHHLEEFYRGYAGIGHAPLDEEDYAIMHGIAHAQSDPDHHHDDETDHTVYTPDYSRLKSLNSLEVYGHGDHETPDHGPLSDDRDSDYETLHHHSDGKTYLPMLGCGHCGWTGYTPDARQAHIQESHPGEYSGPSRDMQQLDDILKQRKEEEEAASRGESGAFPSIHPDDTEALHHHLTNDDHGHGSMYHGESEGYEPDDAWDIRKLRGMHDAAHREMEEENPEGRHGQGEWGYHWHVPPTEDGSSDYRRHVQMPNYRQPDAKYDLGPATRTHLERAHDYGDEAHSSLDPVRQHEQLHQDAESYPEDYGDPPFNHTHSDPHTAARGEGPFDRNDPQYARERDQLKDYPKPIGPYSTYGDGPDLEFYRPQIGESGAQHRDRIHTKWSDENTDTTLRRQHGLPPNPDAASLGGEFVKRDPERTCAMCGVNKASPYNSLQSSGFERPDKPWKGRDYACDSCYDYMFSANIRGNIPGYHTRYNPDTHQHETMSHGPFKPDMDRLKSLNHLIEDDPDLYMALSDLDHELRKSNPHLPPGAVADAAELNLPHEEPHHLASLIYGAVDEVPGQQYLPGTEPDHSGHLPNPIEGGHDWHHGSPKNGLQDIRDPYNEDDDEPWDDEGEHAKHWNSYLGDHWTSMRGVAESFGKGAYHHQHDSDKGEGAVFTANLGIKNPKVYGSESRMDSEAVQHAFDHHDVHDPSDIHSESCENPWGHTCHDYEQHVENYGPEDEVSAHLLKHYSDPHHAAHWLGSHPEKEDIASNFKRRLQNQGHDGIVYGNEVEGPSHHPCAITFDRDQAQNLRRSGMTGAQDHGAMFSRPHKPSEWVHEIERRQGEHHDTQQEEFDRMRGRTAVTARQNRTAARARKPVPLQMTVHPFEADPRDDEHCGDCGLPEVNRHHDETQAPQDWLPFPREAAMDSDGVHQHPSPDQIKRIMQTMRETWPEKYADHDDTDLEHQVRTQIEKTRDRGIDDIY